MELWDRSSKHAKHREAERPRCAESLLGALGPGSRDLGCDVGDEGRMQTSSPAAEALRRLRRWRSSWPGLESCRGSLGCAARLSEIRSEDESAGWKCSGGRHRAAAMATTSPHVQNNDVQLLELVFFFKHLEDI